MSSKLRPVELCMSVPDINSGTKGFFHDWCHESYFLTDRGETLKKTYALIEFLDGKMKMIEPEAIRFTDLRRKTNNSE